MIRALDVVTSVAATLARAGAGTAAEAPAQRPVETLELYDFEACPFCRRAREALSELDLDAIVYPCPKGGTRFRPKARELGGKEQFPYLVDSNTQTAMYESADIVTFLERRFSASPD